MIDKDDKKGLWPDCNDKRPWCCSRVNGQCVALKETYPHDVECPFYKKNEKK